MPRLLDNVRLLVATLLVTAPPVLLAGCQTKPQTKTKDANQVEETWATPQEAAAAFDRAEAELGDMLLSTGPTPAQPVPVSPEPSPTAPYRVEPDARGHELALADRCTRACKALASMQRAADRLCQLTGEDDDRCKSVRARVEAARVVVQSACPDCDA